MKKIVIAALAFALTVSLTMPASAAKFKDVGEQHSLQIEIEYLASEGIINGYSDGTFKPNAPIAKKHIAAMLVKALELPTTNVQNPGYADVPTTHPYYKEIAAAYTAGIFGKATNFKPESSISRAFMAKILSTSFNLKSIAKNAVTYRDVAKNDEFHTPIQLVTMNNVAQGYRNVEGQLPDFKPNALLTRAHFSAFLARAMSLKGGNYKPDTNYSYYYKTVDDENYMMTYDYSDVDENGVIDYWDFYNADTNELASKDVYMLGAGYWVQGVQSSDFATFSPYPFTVGMKYNSLNDEYGIAQRLRVLNTNEDVRVGGVNYSEVVVIEEAWPVHNDRGQFVKIDTSTLYVAKDYGIVGVKDARGYWTMWLSRRVAR
ncbi:MAG: S-layer homology domain-containing protein [Caryophanon sp.]|nr:S-layer homology domain-containing protein [Caryophanon sp.]